MMGSNQRRFMSKWIFSCFAATVCGTAWAATATTTSEDTGLEEITVTAERFTSTIQNTPIHAIVSLASEPDPVAGAAALKKIAVRRCGERVASASWGVEIYYTEAPMASAAANQSFVVKTPNGWRAY